MHNAQYCGSTVVFGEINDAVNETFISPSPSIEPLGSHM